jgi:hypothetical protein
MGTSRPINRRETWGRIPPARWTGGRCQIFFQSSREGLFVNKFFLFTKRPLPKTSRPTGGREVQTTMPSAGLTPRCLLSSTRSARRPVPTVLRPPQPWYPFSRTFRTVSSRWSPRCCPTTRPCHMTLTSRPRPRMSAPRLHSWRDVECTRSSTANFTSCPGTQVSSWH